METRGNYVLVGLFTVITFLAAFAFVFWTARYGDTANRVPIVISIPGSAAGLTRGSPILFNGIRVGDVTRVSLDTQNPQLAFAEAEVDRQTPIKPSTKAALTVQGLTGQAYVELTGGLGSEPNLITDSLEGPLVINADPSFFTDVAASTRAVLARADTILARVDELTEQLGGPILETARNAETFSAALAARSDDIDAFLGSVGEMGTASSQIATQAQPLIGRVDALVAAIDPDQVSNTVSNIELFTERLSSASTGLEDLVTTIDDVAAETLSLVQNAGGVVRNLEGITSSVAPEDVQDIVNDVREATGSIRALSESLGEQRDDVTRIVTAAREMTERLNAASMRVDGVLQKVDALLGSDEAGALGGELNQTLAEYRRLAETLNARVPAIAAGIERFTGAGLRDVERSVGSAQQSIERIERAITDLSRNPQRVITGGTGEVRTFDGRQRR